MSFVTTVRNGSTFIDDWASSIIAQDISNWEAVIVEDGSGDRTPMFLQKLAAEDKRFRVHLTDGVGRGKALNLALSLCASEIVCNLDIDDLAHPSRARVARLTLDANPKYGVIAGKSQMFFSGKERPNEWLELEGPVAVTDVTRVLPYRNPVGHSAVAMRRRSPF